jgi:hypothetical protein
MKGSIDLPALRAAGVLDDAAIPRRFGELVAPQGRARVVVWLRHFGCTLCRDQVARLAPLEARFDGAGAPLLFVGSGTPQQGAALRARIAFRAPVVCDPDRTTYAAAGLVRSLAASVNPAAVPGALGALLRGHGAGTIQGDPWQQGGALVLDAAGAVVFHHRNRHVSDLVAEDALLAAAGAV